MTAQEQKQMVLEETELRKLVDMTRKQRRAAGVRIPKADLERKLAELERRPLPPSLEGQRRG